MHRFLLTLVLTALVGCIGPASAERSPSRVPSVETIARTTLASTLKVDIVKAGGGGHGSAWVVAPGLAVTARHVTHGALTLRMTNRDGEDCKILRWVEHPDEEQDISLVVFEGCEAPPLHIRTRKVTEGTTAFVAGHPFWSSWTFTAGIVSDADEGGRIQLDAVAEPGMSGGPVVDKHGRVMGMAVSILAEPLMHTWGGETFVVPVKDIMVFVLETSLGDVA